MAKEIKTSENQLLSQQLLALVAEEMKTPLTQVARLTELAQLGAGDLAAGLSDIRSITKSAIDLVESYSLALRLASWRADRLPQEPVAASAVLAEVIKGLEPLAKSYNIDLKLELVGYCQPVIVNRQALAAALTSAGSSLVKAISTDEAGTGPQLRLCLHNSGSAVEVGWYWSAAKIDAEVWRRGQDIEKTCSRPLASFTSETASGLFIADYILNILSSRLRTSRYRGFNGFAARLEPSAQLALIN